MWGGREQPGAGEIREQFWSADEAPLLDQGQEMGRFFLGSTVVMVTEASGLAWANEAGDAVTVRSVLAEA